MRLTFEEIMQRSFVVSIDNERLKAFYQEFSSAGFPIDLLSKRFIGYEITDKYLIGKFDYIASLQQSPRRGILERCLNLIHSLCNNASHFALVQHAKLLDWPFVTIFEDDAVPENGCIDKLNEYCANVPDDTDVLRLGYLKDQHIRKEDRVQPEIVHDNFIVQTLGGSHAYIVFKKYYQKFLETNKDQPRCDFDKINPTPDKVVYALKESLFKQQNVPDRPVIHAWRLKNGMVKLPPAH